MGKYKFVIRKIQTAIALEDFGPDETVGDVLDRISEKNEEELEFSEPQYELVAISKEEGKVSRFVWKDPGL